MNEPTPERVEEVASNLRHLMEAEQWTFKELALWHLKTVEPLKATISKLEQEKQELKRQMELAACTKCGVVHWGFCNQQLLTLQSRCEMQEKALVQFCVSVAYVSEMRGDFSKAIALREQARLPATPLLDALRECVGAMTSEIKGKHIGDYLAEQFPATAGHIPLLEWIIKLDIARNTARSAMGESKQA